MVKTLFVLFEHASGYALFERVESEEIAMELESVEKSISALKTFTQILKMKAFAPFPSSETALENIKGVSEGICSEYLKGFLDANLPKVKSAKKAKKAKFSLGLEDFKIASAIQEKTNIPCLSNDMIRELLRGVRKHFKNFVKGLSDGDIGNAQLGLSHHYSQEKVKYSIKREDNMVIQSICLLDTVDKDLNSHYMKIQEWYSWHFPELKIEIKDNLKYVKMADIIKNRNSLLSKDKEEIKNKKKQINELLGSKEQTKKILALAERSIGFDMAEIDVYNLNLLVKRHLSLYHYRKTLFDYLKTKMENCAPNLSAVIGEMVGARLISHAGGLLNLCKYPASTVQVLGAEKALFRALKTKSRTPKYGLIFHSSFISRAARKDKGRISRFLANKCSIASRIDCFSDKSDDIYGTKMRNQIEERLEFLNDGKRPARNTEVMHSAKIEREMTKENSSTKSSDKISDKISKKKSKKSEKRKLSKKADSIGKKSKKLKKEIAVEN